MKKLIGAIFALALSAPTMAATCTSTASWGNLGPPDTQLFGNSFGSRGSYLDCYSFTLSQPADAFGGVVEWDLSFVRDIDVTSVSLFNGGVLAGTTGSLFASFANDGAPVVSFSFAGLGADMYTFAVASNVTGLNLGRLNTVGYEGGIRTNRGNTVPEPGSLALLGLGLAGLGLMRRRRT